MILGVGVFVVDVATNVTVYATIGGLSLFGVLCQALFGVLILVTARRLSTWFGVFRGNRADREVG